MKKLISDNQLTLPFEQPVTDMKQEPSVTIDKISMLFKEVFRQYANRSKKRYALIGMDVSFYPYRTLKHTLRYRDHYAKLKISDFAVYQTEEYFELLAYRLWSDLFRMKCPENYRRRFDEMEKRLDLQLRGNGQYRFREKKIINRGMVYDLDEILKSISRIFGFGAMPGLRIGWSRNKAKRRLGYYGLHSKTIMISSILDHQDVPLYVVQYIVYHELLHHIIPVENTAKGKKYHGRFYKQYEKKFHMYEQAVRWLKKEYPGWLAQTEKGAKRNQKK